MKKIILLTALVTTVAYAASTFTTNYDLEKPAQGDANWASALNGNSDTIDTQMFVNQTSITNHVADTTGAHAATAISTAVGTDTCTVADDVQEFLQCLDTNFGAIVGGNVMTTNTAQNISGVKTFTVGQIFSAGINVTGGIINAGGLSSGGATTLSALGVGVVHSDGAGLLSSSNIVNADIDAAAAIDRSKIAAGTNNHVVINDGTGLLSSEAQLAVSRGGTGQSTQTAAFDALDPLTTKGDLIVHNGTNSIREAVGANDFVLTADSTQASGIKWAAAASSIDYATEFSNATIATSVAANALTIALKQKAGTDCSTGSAACNIGFRSDTATSGVYNRRQQTAALSLVISSGSTLGMRSGVSGVIWVYAIDSDGAGTIKLGASLIKYDEGTEITTVAEGGAGAADAGNVLYSDAVYTLKPIRLIGKVTISEATAGTWATQATEVTTAPFSDSTQERWIAYTPTITGFGTPTNVLAISRRVGGSLEYKITFTSGITTTTEARVSIGYRGTNANVTSEDSSLLPTISHCGTVVKAPTVITAVFTSLCEQSKTYLTFGINNATTDPLTKQDADAIFSTGENISIVGSVPIVGWN
jgi:hypothetical protein